MPNQIQIDLTLNDSQFAANIRNANGEVKSFSAAVNALQTSLKGLESKAATGSISDLTERLRSAKDQLETTDRSGKSYETALKRVAVITKQLGDAQDQAVKSVKSFQVSLSSVNAGPSAGSITDLNQRLYEAKAALESADPSSRKYELALKRAAVISSQLRTAQENTSSAIAGALKNLHNETVSGGKEIQANIGLLKDLSEAAKNGGKNAVDSLVNNKKLSEGQLSTLISQLKDYRENVTSIKGGIAPNIDKGCKEIAMQLQLSRNDVTETITVLEEYQKSLNKEPEPNGLIPKLRKQVEELKKTLDNSTSKPIMRAIESKITQLERYINYLENLDKQGISGKDIPEIEFSFSSESQEKMFKALKESFERQGMPWDATHKAFAAALVLKAEPETAAANTKKAPASMKPVKVNNNGGIKDAAQLTDKELDNLQFKADLLKGVFTEVGDALVDGMFEGKIAVEELIETIGKLIIKMLLMKAIEATVNAILPGAGSVLGAIFHEGGVADSPKSVRRVSPNVFNGAKKYHTGLMPNEMPAIITKDEMILTKGQQGNLFSLLNKSLSKTNNVNKQQVEVVISGGLVAKGNDFYLDVHRNTNKLLKRITV